MKVPATSPVHVPADVSGGGGKVGTLTVTWKVGTEKSPYLCKEGATCILDQQEAMEVFRSAFKLKTDFEFKLVDFPKSGSIL